jgi:thiamine phosphate synthase YjbQ (UPF0047 family)
MSSTTGIKDGDFDRLNIAFDLGVGLDNEFGTDGQVLISGGENEPLRWGSNITSAPNPLRQGTNIQIVRTSDASNLGSYDGSIDATINSTDTIYQANLGVEIDTSTSPDTIKAKVDSSAQPTLRNDLNSDELAVLRVPNNLTANLGLEYQSGITSYDGSAQTTIITKVDDTTPGTQTISNSGGTGFDELNVLRVPNTLTITDSAGTSIVFDGSTAKSITINDDDTTYQADLGVEIDTSTNPDTIKAKVDSSAQPTLRNDLNSNELAVLRVPNTLTITDSAGTSVVFDGSSTETITINDNDTTYQADLGVEIDTSTNPDTIKAKVDSSAQPTLRNDLNSNELAVLRVPNSLSVNLGLEYQSGSNFDGSDTRTMVAKVDDTTPGTQTISNSGGTGFDELNVLRVPNTLTITDSAGTSVVFDGSTPKSITINDNDTTYQADLGVEIDTSTNPDTIKAKVDSSAQPTLRNDLNSNELAVLRVPNTLTIQNGNTTITFDGSANQSITIAQGSIDHTQVSRIGQQLAETINQFPFFTTAPTMTSTNFTTLPGWGIENLTAVATDYMIELSFQMFSPGATTTTSGTFCRGVMRLDKEVATTSTSSWSAFNGIYSPVMFGGVKITGGTFNFNSAVLSTGVSLWNGRVHYTYIVSNLTIGDSYNFIPKFYSYHNTTLKLKVILLYLMVVRMDFLLVVLFQ